MSDPDALLGRLGYSGSWQTLIPHTQESARPGTQSAKYGLGAFPWHTDGAIAKNPPRLIALHAHSHSDTATEVLDLLTHDGLCRGLQHMVLRTQSLTGPSRYVSAAERVGGVQRFRWDPDKLVICRPYTDPGIATLEPSAIIDWRAGELLIVDNWRCLHRRQAARTDETRALRRMYIYN